MGGIKKLFNKVNHVGCNGDESFSGTPGWLNSDPVLQDGKPLRMTSLPRRLLFNKPTWTNESSGRKLFLPFLTLASLFTIFLLSLFLSILPSTNKGKALGESDTGKATLNKVYIAQAGTGSSVTINGKTYAEGKDTKNKPQCSDSQRG